MKSLKNPSSKIRKIRKFFDMKLIRYSVIFILFVGCLLSIYVPLKRPGWGETDFIRYWTASKLLLTGQNPYDSHALYDLQIAIRPVLADSGDFVQAWNPPWLLLILSPLTTLPFNLASDIWIFINVVMITYTIYLLWLMEFNATDLKGYLLLLGAGFLFIDTIVTISIGQISAILLFGLVLWIWLFQKRQYYLSGVPFLLLFTKPQVTFLVILVMLLYIIRKRCWAVLISLVVLLIVSFVLSWICYPGWLSSYLHLLLSLPYSNIYTTTLGSFFETIFGVSVFKYFGLLLVPLAIPLSRSIDKYGLLTVTNIALVISLPIAPYGFSFDHMLLLPAIAQMIAWIKYKKIPTTLSILIASGLFLIYSVLYLMGFRGLPYFWYVFPSLGITILYGIAWIKRYEFQTEKS